MPYIRGGAAHIRIHRKNTNLSSLSFVLSDSQEAPLQGFGREQGFPIQGREGRFFPNSCAACVLSHKGSFCGNLFDRGQILFVGKLLQVVTRSLSKSTHFLHSHSRRRGRLLPITRLISYHLSHNLQRVVGFMLESFVVLLRFG